MTDIREKAPDKIFLQRWMDEITWCATRVDDGGVDDEYVLREIVDSLISAASAVNAEFVAGGITANYSHGWDRLSKLQKALEEAMKRVGEG